MQHIYCPHCLERVLVQDSSSPGLCPVCARALDGSGLDNTVPKDYQVNAPEVQPLKQKEVKEYGRFLANRARKELDRKPYFRKPPRVNLWAGLILIGIGLAITVAVIRSGEGMMSILINGILFPSVFFLCGAACLMFWKK